MKSLSTLHIAALLLCLPAQTFCMETYISQQLVQNTQLYHNKCKEIDTQNKDTFNNFLNHLLSTANAHVEINRIENTLKHLEQGIAKKREAILFEIKIRHNINETDWLFCTKTIQAVDDCMKNISPCTATHCTQNIPNYFYSMLLEKFKENDIDSKKITLSPCETSSFEINPSRYNYSIIPETQVLKENDNYEILWQNNVSIQQITPCEIKLNPEAINSLNQTAAEGLCILLASSVTPTCHIIRHVSIIEEIIKTKIDKDSLGTMELILKILTFALKNTNYAKCLKSLFKNINSETFFPINDYSQLSEIHRLHETLECLKNMHPVIQRNH